MNTTSTAVMPMADYWQSFYVPGQGYFVSNWNSGERRSFVDISRILIVNILVSKYPSHPTNCSQNFKILNAQIHMSRALSIEL